MLPTDWIVAQWPGLAGNVRAFVTTRHGGVSSGSFASFNPAAHVGDDPAAVARNREILASFMPGAEPLVFASQVHGTQVLPAGLPGEADAIYTDQPNKACMVMTADCLPVFFASDDGKQLAVAHAGWRGLSAGVLEQTVNAFSGSGITAWLGPAIGPQQFEVGEDVLQSFLESSPSREKSCQAFTDHGPGHYLCNLYLLARHRLEACGINRVYGGGFCTVSDARFFSYRRDGQCGRMVSVIYRTD